MGSAGEVHTVLLRSDGNVDCCGRNLYGQCNIPALEEGMKYTQVSAGQSHTVLLRSDGSVVACGLNNHGQCNIPPGSYTQVSAGGCHTVLLTREGRAVACGQNVFGQCNIPCGSYTQVSAGDVHTALLRRDGRVAFCGRNFCGQCNMPQAEEGVWYTQVAAAVEHTVLLRSDGQVVACGNGGWGLKSECYVPPAPDGVAYTQVAAGGLMAALLRSDGWVLRFGLGRPSTKHSWLVSESEQEEIEEFLWSEYLDVESEEVSIQVSTSSSHTVLIRSDGSAISFYASGSFPLSPPEPGIYYLGDRIPGKGHRVLQVEVAREDEIVHLACLGLAGQEVLRWSARESELALNTHEHIATKLNLMSESLHMVLPDGRLLTAVCQANPVATLGDLCNS